MVSSAQVMASDGPRHPPARPRHRRQLTAAQAAEWSMFAIAFLLVLTRLGVRVAWKQTYLVLSDVFLVGGVLCALAVVISDTISYRVGAMDSDDMMYVAYNYFYDIGLYLPKLSMLVIYTHLIPRHNLLWKPLYVVIVITVGCALVALFSDTFWCGWDPSVNWDIDDGMANTLLADCAVFLLPFPLLMQPSSMQWTQKVGLALLFTLGLVTLTVSIGRCIVTLGGLGGRLDLNIWAFAEFAVSIMIVACTALRPLVTKVWRIASSHDKSQTNRMGQSKRSYSQTIGGVTSVAAATQYKGTTKGTDVEDLTGSEVELTDLQKRSRTTKTECVSVSSDRRSESDSFAGDNGTWNEWGATSSLR
ncbi:Fc.00g000070.m01.CDS01 [Cosmosporella sp. VM-42]